MSAATAAACQGFITPPRIQLELLEQRRFGDGVVNLRYRIQC
jgi:hypothetical protein